MTAIAVLGIVSLGLSGSAGASSSPLTWSESPSALEQFAYGFPPRTLSFPQAGNSAFASVSCVNSHFCVAVGAYSSSPPLDTLIEKWDGTGWSVMPRSAVQGGTLTSVSCSGPTFCAVVGYGPTGSGTAALLQRWNGTTWILDAAPAVSMPNSTLSSVSCVSRISCVAVGSTTDATTSRTLVEHWNGATWSVLASANAARGSSSLNGVSCRSTTVCVAVGAHRADASSSEPLSERWNGTTWMLLTNPTLPAPASLTGISCITTSVCVAVGANGHATLAQTLNAHVWTVIASPSGPAGTRTGFASVSCPRATDCVATEQFSGASPSSVHGGVETWNGSVWSTGLGFSGEPGGLGGVSCADKTFCFAVGGFNFPSHGTTALLGRT